MTVTINSEATSKVSESYEPKQADGSQVRIDHLKRAVGTVSCGVLEQTGDDSKGAAGWVEDTTAKGGASKVVNSEYDQQFTCNDDLCYAATTR